MEYIELENITKTFGEIKANSQISFAIKRGEVLSILGENGSGIPPLIALVSLGIQDTFFFLVSGFLTALYWNTEAEKKIKTRPAPCFAGAVCETAELAAMVIFLILCDELIF